MENAHHHEHQSPTTSTQGSPAWMLPASILVAALLISGSLIYTMYGGNRATTETTPEETAAVQAKAPGASERDAILGDPNAPVTVIAYEDFQCPFCARFHDEGLAQIRDAYVATGKVKLVYRHLAFLGPESIAAAEASECAKDQGKFWEFHDALFGAELIDGQEHNGNLNRTLFTQIASELKLDAGVFASCVDSGTHKDFVAAQVAEAGAQYGVQSTPTIFVNDKKVEGAYPFETFKDLIEAEL
jgi:protein-disulfide isomerase